MSAKNQLQAALDKALAQFQIEGVAPENLQIVPATNPQFGDYQFNGALSLAKALRQKPRDIATQIIEKLDVSEVSETPEIAGAGFINFRLKTSWLNEAISKAKPEYSAPTRHKYVVDYPSPNVAKPLHVGHIRTTFIGDAVVRLLRFAGHEVITDNHIGDWGTPIGKVIVGWKKYRDDAAFAKSPLDEMGRLYALVNAQADLLDEAREATAKLQSGDPENTAIWEILRDNSMPLLNALWERVGVKTDVTLGESFYQPLLAGIIEELAEKGIAVESEGALVIPFETDDLRERPMLVRKSDGSALYATTDLATIKYRMETWNPDGIIYVVDARQALHFRQLFAAAKKWGYEDVEFKHVAFGTILGENGKPISTRDGVTSKLELLLDEAQKRAEVMAKDKSPDLTEEQLVEVGRVVGIAAVKYADLSPNRTSDYIFSWDKMLALNGNSAVYLYYAYVRTQSVIRRIGESTDGKINLVEPAEIDLAKKILLFGDAIENALSDFRPHLLCDYIYELSGNVSAFWRDCNIKDAPDDIRASRLALVELTGEVLKTSLNLLGIETVDQM